MPIKPFQAKLFAYELARQLPSNNIGKFTASLQDAQVDLNPHQVDAAMFAFKSPLSNGALLADEVGLGKTIEAGIILSQKWAERKRKLLIIGPANLRKQWNQELQDKFFLPSVILEAKSFNANVDNGNFNPFSQKDAIVICSFQFAKAKAAYLKKTDWDLVVIDEAHRLRNVYKPTNQIGNAIKNALNGKKKILLTATPLQNTLQELYGLVSIIDDYYFGDLKSFNAQYAKQLNEVNFGELRNRLLPVCHRTLRKQVREYIKYTDRIAIRQEFYPTEEEQKLYDDVSEFLRRPQLYSMPNSQRLLMTLIARKLLASSTFAINGTLQSMIKRLEALVAENDTNLKAELIEDYEGADNFQEEKGANENDETPDDEDENESSTQLTNEDIAAIKVEIADLKGYQQLAFQIKVNSKANHLLIALESGFKQLESDKKTADGQRAARKALIFTESKRTQQFLYELLEESGYKDKIVLFNGSNNDAKSNAIYKAWLKKHKGSDKISGSATADKRAALVEYFKHEAVIMIATEAAAEGINLQFCSLIVNYDMPWNPQRIEQRIGRCHRYGQNFDVVVVNFLNMANAADQHVYITCWSKNSNCLIVCLVQAMKYWEPLATGLILKNALRRFTMNVVPTTK
jgi:SNF2 family DNA or RNA helicase